MIQAFASNRQGRGRRGVAALLLAVFLNLALVPCTMALEVVEEGHDCCPPELNLEALECCELDDVSIDSRGASKCDADDADISLPSAPVGASLLATALCRVATDPPDPPDLSPDLNALFCVYLN